MRCPFFPPWLTRSPILVAAASSFSRVMRYRARASAQNSLGLLPSIRSSSESEGGSESNGQTSRNTLCFSSLERESYQSRPITDHLPRGVPRTKPGRAGRGPAFGRYPIPGQTSPLENRVHFRANVLQLLHGQVQVVLLNPCRRPAESEPHLQRVRPCRE